MKILFAIKALDDTKGGAERVLSDISSGLADRGHEIIILTFDQPGGRSFYPLNSKVRRICLGLGHTDRKTNITEFTSRIKALRKTIKEEKPDIVIAFMHSTFVPMAFALAGTNIPVIASEHIVPRHYKTRPIEYLLFMLCSLFVKKITVLSERIKSSYPYLLRTKMVSIANPVHVQADTTNKKMNSNGRNIILNVGRLTHQKDQKPAQRPYPK